MNASNTLETKATTVFERNWNALNSETRFIKNEGGSRSSKTFSICQCLILYAIQNPNKVISIIRRTGPALKASVYRDFFQVLRELNLYKEDDHKKGEGYYQFPNGSIIEFFSADMEQKLRGRKRDIAWLNEANECNYDIFQQIALRTTDKIIVDYNPSAMDSYLYYLPEDRTVSIHSTYLDNPFLEQSIIDQILSYQDKDPDYYTIFALGQRCFSKENVFHQWVQCEKPEYLTDFVYGIDYGYTHPTALVKVWYSKISRELWLEELIYESYLTATDIVEKMKSLNVSTTRPIISETARPEIVQDLKRAGYTVINANKNVDDGIMTMKSFKIQVSPLAENIIKENFNYRYQKINGVVTDRPIKSNDDSIDAIRYATMYIKKYCLEENKAPQQVYRFDF